MTEQDWAVSETEVLESARDLLDAGRPGVLATVVDVEGSAYRRPGAKMVVDRDGEGYGAITSGCLEDEVLELARDVLDAGEPRIETYDLMNDEDDVWGLGVGCNGIIDVLIEPLDASFRPAIDAVDAGERVGVITVLSGDGVALGDRGYYSPGEGVSGDLPAWLGDAVADAAAELTGRGKADSVRIDTEDGAAEVFIDGIEPAPSLVVIGSGHDAAPVVDLAAKNDFRTTVIGFRGATDLDARFPHADETVSASPASLRDAFDFDADTYVVVMTHNFVDDRLAVDELARTDAPYIGLLGPRERFEDMLDDFADEDRSFTDDELDRIYTPVGLDLGGGAPYQIATSIVAEAIAVANDRTPQHLKDREGRIHDRVEVGTPSTD